jgi:hypothetical protein
MLLGNCTIWQSIRDSPRAPHYNGALRRIGMPREWNRPAAALIVAALAVVAYAGTLRNGFVFDDLTVVVNNPVVHGPLDVRSWLATDFLGARRPNLRGGLWRPLPTITLWLDQHVAAGEPWMFHLTNVLFHALASLALTWAVYRQAGQLRIAVITGSIFAVLAINSEAVAGVVSRADVMAAGFGFLAWACVAPFAEPLDGRHLAGFSAALLAALISKESAVAFAGSLIVACTAVYLTNRHARSHLPSLQLVLATGAVLLVYVAARQRLIGPVSTIGRLVLNNPLLDEPLQTRIWTGFSLLTLTVERTLFPRTLVPDYSFAAITPIRTPFETSVEVGVLILVALLGCAWRLRRHSTWLVGVAMFVTGWAALSNIPIALPIIFAERLLYGMMGSAALLIGIVIDAVWLRHRKAAFVLLSAVVVGNGARTIVRVRDWHDELRLFARATRDAPTTARAWNNLGASLIQVDEAPQALDALHRAMAIAPDWSPPYVLEGNALASLQRPVEAEASFRRAYALDPNNAQAAYSLTGILVQSGHRAEGVLILQRYVSLHPQAIRERNLLDRLTAR